MKRRQFLLAAAALLTGCSSLKLRENVPVKPDRFIWGREQRTEPKRNNLEAVADSIHLTVTLNIFERDKRIFYWENIGYGVVLPGAVFVSPYHVVNGNEVSSHGYFGTSREKVQYDGLRGRMTFLRNPFVQGNNYLAAKDLVDNIGERVTQLRKMGFFVLRPHSEMESSDTNLFSLPGEMLEYFPPCSLEIKDISRLKAGTQLKIIRPVGNSAEALEVSLENDSYAKAFGVNPAEFFVFKGSVQPGFSGLPVVSSDYKELYGLVSGRKMIVGLEYGWAIKMGNYQQKVNKNTHPFS
ncbi:hypothetical protein J4212_08360 [Candidatus Woesearchaeota archaeon]|nr:hypothetical protein [Candidatus Woesearchaeota archaeon]